MTLNIMMLLILILPIPILVTDLQKGRSPFRAILKGALAAGVGIAFVFAIAQLTGHGIGNEIQQNISRVAGLLADNPQVAKFPQFDDLSRGERAAAIRQAAGNAMNALPASLLVIAAIVSWLEGLIIGQLIRADGRPKNPVPSLGTLTLPRSIVIVWLCFLVTGWLLRMAQFSGSAVLQASIQVLFDFIFALQGLSLILHFSEKKHIPKVVAVIVAIVLLFTGIGQTILTFLGVIDLAFGLRSRIRAR